NPWCQPPQCEQAMRSGCLGSLIPLLRLKRCAHQVAPQLRYCNIAPSAESSEYDVASGHYRASELYPSWSAHSPKADIVALAADVGLGPFPDSCAAARRVYSMISSARPDKDSGTVMPSALAVLRLMANSIFVTCCTGRSAGFSPLRIRAVLTPT